MQYDDRQRRIRLAQKPFLLRGVSRASVVGKIGVVEIDILISFDGVKPFKVVEQRQNFRRKRIVIACRNNTGNARIFDCFRNRARIAKRACSVAVIIKKRTNLI